MIWISEQDIWLIRRSLILSREVNKSFRSLAKDPELVKPDSELSNNVQYETSDVDETFIDCLKQSMFDSCECLMRSASDLELVNITEMT